MAWVSSLDKPVAAGLLVVWVSFFLFDPLALLAVAARGFADDLMLLFRDLVDDFLGLDADGFFVEVEGLRGDFLAFNFCLLSWLCAGLSGAHREA